MLVRKNEKWAFGHYKLKKKLIPKTVKTSRWALKAVTSKDTDPTCWFCANTRRIVAVPFLNWFFSNSTALLSNVSSGYVQWNVNCPAEIPRWADRAPRKPPGRATQTWSRRVSDPPSGPSSAGRREGAPDQHRVSDTREAADTGRHSPSSRRP